jgi:hypothetical protein
MKEQGVPPAQKKTKKKKKTLVSIHNSKWLAIDMSQ